MFFGSLADIYMWCSAQHLVTLSTYTCDLVNSISVIFFKDKKRDLIKKVKYFDIYFPDVAYIPLSPKRNRKPWVCRELTQTFSWGCLIVRSTNLNFHFKWDILRCSRISTGELLVLVMLIYDLNTTHLSGNKKTYWWKLQLTQQWMLWLSPNCGSVAVRIGQDIWVTPQYWGEKSGLSVSVPDVLPGRVGGVAVLINKTKQSRKNQKRTCVTKQSKIILMSCDFCCALCK